MDGLVSLYEVTSEEGWLTEAESLAEEMINLFHDPITGLFFDTSHEHDTPLVRPRDIFDNPMPCGGSAAAMARANLRSTVFPCLSTRPCCQWAWPALTRGAVPSAASADGNSALR